MTNPRGQAALNAQRKWRAAHPEARSSGGTPEQKRARREQIKAISPCYLKEARAILAGTKRRINRCAHLEGDDDV